MMRIFFGFKYFPFKKYIDTIFVSRQLEYLQKRCLHLLETQGLMLLTGEIGSGKTTFIRNFVSSLNYNSYQLIYISETIRTARSFYRLLAGQLGIIPKYRIEDLSGQVKNGLLNLYTKNKLKPILIIDEAQNLSDTILEEIRLLTNYRMDSHHYLSVFLLAHPVLKAQLKLPPYAALKQRLSFSYHLTGLEHDEAHLYIAHRLKLAGCSTSMFSKEAITLIFNYAKGLPRLIDKLAHEALFKAAFENSLSIDESMIELIIHEWEDL